MRIWLKVFLLTLTVMLGGSALWVWSAALTGNVGKTVVLTEPNGFDIAGIIRANTFALHQLGTDPAPGPDWLLYTLASGPRMRDPSGNITNLFGAGGGGTAVFPAVRAATTANLTFPIVGTQIIDDLSIGTGSPLVLVKDQSNQTQNGLYVASATLAWTRSTNFNESAEFTAGFPVYVQPGGTLNGNTVWNFSTMGSFTLGTSNVTFGRTGLGDLGELQSNKNINNGYMGLTNVGKAPWNRVHGYATHIDLGVGSQINAATLQVSSIGIQNAGAGNVTLTSGTPITGCTAATDSTELTILGIHATKTVTLQNGPNLLLAGNTGSVVIGLYPGGTTLKVRCNGAVPRWEQINVPTLQQIVNLGSSDRTLKDIDGLTTSANGQRKGNIAGGDYCIDYGNTRDCYCSGVLCTTTTIANPLFAFSGSRPPCNASNRFQPWGTPGTTGAGASADVIENCTKDAFDVYDWRSSGGTSISTTTIPLRLDTANFADANAVIIPQDRTNYDTNVIEFVDTGPGCIHFKTHIPANVAATPAWNVIMYHSASSGTGGPIQLTLSATTNLAKSASLTGLTLASSGVVTVDTSANVTGPTTLGATNFDGMVAIAANQLLRLQLCRTPAAGGDTLGVSWYLESIVLRFNAL